MAMKRDEELELIADAQRGRAEARKKLLEAHRPLAAGRAKREAIRWSRHITSDEAQDLFQLAWLAIDRAIDTFKPDKGARLCTHAGYAIRGAFTAERRKREGAKRDSCPGQKEASLPANLSGLPKRFSLSGDVRVMPWNLWPEAVHEFVMTKLHGPDRFHVLAIWRYGWTPAQVARHLDMSDQAVNQRSKRLRTRLIKRFGQLIFDNPRKPILNRDLRRTDDAKEWELEDDRGGDEYPMRGLRDGVLVAEFGQTIERYQSAE